MPDIKEEITAMLNQSLALEHAARIQYLAHAELVRGLNAEKIIERLKEIASDEEKHEASFRALIGSYLEAEPTMAVAQTHRATAIGDILRVNLDQEKKALDLYKRTYRMIVDNKDSLLYVFEKLEHDVRHVIMDEEEHVTELTLLLG